MATSSDEKSRLHIRHHCAEYIVVRDCPRPESIRARLDEAAARDLPAGLRACLANWSTAEDDEVCLIRRLNVKLSINAAWDRDALARTWAVQIVRAIADLLRRGADGENVLVFPHRAAYLERFLGDVAEGRAWNKWYYSSFDGLRSLPTSAALRAAIIDRPDVGLAALIGLPADRLDRVLHALSTHDVGLVLETIARDSPPGNEARCFTAALTAWQHEREDAFDLAGERRQALRLYLAAARAETGVGGTQLRAAVLALARLGRLYSSGANRERIRSALEAGDAETFLQAAPEVAEPLAPILGAGAERLQAIARALRARQNPETKRPGTEPSHPRHTPFGGIFLLLALLDEFPFETATRGWPDAGKASALTIARLLILAKCCGRARAEAVFHDPLIRDVMAIPPSIRSADVSDWQAQIPAAGLRQFLEELRDWGLESGSLGGEVQFLVRAGGGGRPSAVLLDATRGVWLFLGGCDPRRPARLIERLEPLLPGEGAEAPVLLSDPEWVGTLRRKYPDTRVIALDDPAVDELAEGDERDERIAGTLPRLDKITEEIRHLSLPPAFGVRRPLDHALSVGAQALMRHFAARVPGFARSSLPYLYRNFLDLPGRLEEEPERRVVHLGQPPLHLVLSTTGIARTTYRVGWLDERPFALFPEG